MSEIKVICAIANTNMCWKKKQGLISCHHAKPHRFCLSCESVSDQEDPCPECTPVGIEYIGEEEFNV